MSAEKYQLSTKKNKTLGSDESKDDRRSQQAHNLHSRTGFTAVDGPVITARFFTNKQPVFVDCYGTGFYELDQTIPFIVQMRTSNVFSFAASVVAAYRISKLKLAPPLFAGATHRLHEPHVPEASSDEVTFALPSSVANEDPLEPGCFFTGIIRHVETHMRSKKHGYVLITNITFL